MKTAPPGFHFRKENFVPFSPARWRLALPESKDKRVAGSGRPCDHGSKQQQRAGLLNDGMMDPRDQERAVFIPPTDIITLQWFW